MTLGAGIALGCVWLCVAGAILSKELTNSGVALFITVAIGMTFVFLWLPTLGQ